MIIVSYDISDDKLRAKFAKYLSRFGNRIQYSVFEIDNSPRIVNK
ncbi:CRISPR-associated endonuclease Cas2 [Lacrimispora saccharolytica]|nr:CRISPR-associated endonuclease Cas2 [Lacrimispora saccharolytica]